MNDCLEVTVRLVVVAGPYRSSTEWGTFENIRRAEALALQLWMLNVAVICPHKNTANFGGAADDQIWLEGAKEIVRRADAVVTLPGWEASEGACGEVELANELGIPVFSNAEEVSEWLQSQA
ncbi:MAG: DUF4406 domain-containing protein [Phycisphaerales bacterium]|nr:MAG: DUF4406 domain-containing protein [Phycisphaerales bacterium]